MKSRKLRADLSKLATEQESQHAEPGHRECLQDGSRYRPEDQSVPKAVEKQLPQSQSHRLVPTRSAKAAA